jgi:hypothetical protein
MVPPAIGIGSKGLHVSGNFHSDRRYSFGSSRHKASTTLAYSIASAAWLLAFGIGGLKSKA